MDKYREALDYYAQLIKLNFNDEKTAYNESFDTLQELVNEYKVLKKAMEMVARYDEDMMVSDEEVIQWYIDKAKEELEDE